MVPQFVKETRTEIIGKCGFNDTYSCFMIAKLVQKKIEISLVFVGDMYIVNGLINHVWNI